MNDTTDKHKFSAWIFTDNLPNKLIKKVARGQVCLLSIHSTMDKLRSPVCGVTYLPIGSVTIAQDDVIGGKSNRNEIERILIMENGHSNSEGDHLASHLRIDKNWSYFDFPWIFIILHFRSFSMVNPSFVHTKSLPLTLKGNSYCEISCHQQLKAIFCTWYFLFNQKLCCRILKHQRIMKIECSSDWYTLFGDSYSSTTSKNTHGSNPCNLHSCQSPRFPNCIRVQRSLNTPTIQFHAVYSHML